MPVEELVIRGREVVLPTGVTAASIHVREGRIASISSYHDVPSDLELIEAADDSVVMPGLVDTHVHINSPGRTEWEGFQTATRAAAAGGVTTLVDMPLNSIPPTTSVAALAAKLAAARDNCHVDVAFWGGVVPGNVGELPGLSAAGVVGFKCFLVPSGVDEFAHVTENDLREAMPVLARLGAPLIVHAELLGPISAAAIGVQESVSEYQTFLQSRPPAAEIEAIQLMIRLSREFETRVHIVHLSAAEAIPILREAQAAGVKITAETCPHYLHFVAENIPNGATEFKCCPPIRGRQNREKLWDGLREGTINIVVSDHSPCPDSLKLAEKGNFLDAWGGIASLQLRLPVIWTEAQRRGFSVVQLAEWMCRSPAALVGLDRSKGSISPGCDADFVIWSPGKTFAVRSELLHQRHKTTPYANEVFQGVVEKTFLGGRKIYDATEIQGGPTGRMLLNRDA